MRIIYLTDIHIMTCYFINMMRVNELDTVFNNGFAVALYRITLCRTPQKYELLYILAAHCKHGKLRYKIFIFVSVNIE
jgi:hypothetical protein